MSRRRGFEGCGGDGVKLSLLLAKVSNLLIGLGVIAAALSTVLVGVRVGVPSLDCCSGHPLPVSCKEGSGSGFRVQG